MEEGKITWYSNYYHTKTSPLHGLEEKEIAVTQTLENHECAGLEENKIAGFSNLLLRCKDKEIAGHSNIYWLIVTAAKGLAEDKITWYSNDSLHGLQSIAGLEEDEVTWYSNAIAYHRCAAQGLEEVKIT